VNDGEWNVGDGTHYYAVRTDGGSCTIQFLLDGYLGYSTVPTTNLSTLLKDIGTYTLSPRIKVTLKDESGNALIDPTIWYDEIYGLEYSVGNDHYIPATVSAARQLKVVYPGYVTEDGSGSGFNAAFAMVSTDSNTQVVINMTNSSGTGCNGSIDPGVTTCRALHRDFIATVNGPTNTPLTGASVTVYMDAGYTTIADDLAKNGANDAQEMSDGDGEVWLALASGTYYLKVTAGGYTDSAVQLPITSGNANLKTVTMAVSGQNPPDTTVSATQSTVSVTPGSILADGVATATFTVTAKNAAGTGLDGKTVTANSSLAGVTITPASATTNSMGTATFTVKSTTQGSTNLTAVAGGVSVNGQATLSFTAVPSDTNVSASQSSIGVSPSSITADGVNTATLTIIAKNASGQALSGKTVTTNSSLAGVTITPASVTTDGAGVASFTVKSTTQGSTTLTAVAGGVSLSGQATVSLTAPIQAQCQSPVAPIGSLVKLPDDGDMNTQIDSAVYYYGADCKRHAFSNSRVYFSWYNDFTNISIVSQSILASMQLGKNVTYRPGVKMIKFTTDNKVYAVSKGGTLRWVKTEAVAIALYGSTWNKNIDDVSDAFYTNYVFGTDINDVSDFNVLAEKNGVTVIDDSL